MIATLSQGDNAAALLSAIVPEPPKLTVAAYLIKLFNYFIDFYDY